MAKVAIIMGSASDLDALKPLFARLRYFEIAYEAHVLSAHRTPDEAAQFARSARDHGFAVIIAAAGKAAHLPGVLAAYTTLPVIGIPIRSSLMDGLDSLLSIVQMPSGVPVATVAVDGAENAAILAAQMIAIRCQDMAARLARYKDEMAQAVRNSDQALRSSEL